MQKELTKENKEAVEWWDSLSDYEKMRLHSCYRVYGDWEKIYDREKIQIYILEHPNK